MIVGLFTEKERLFAFLIGMDCSAIEARWVTVNAYRSFLKGGL